MDGTIERDPEPREPLLGSGSVPPMVEMGADPQVLGGGQLPVEGGLLGEKAEAREEVRIVLSGHPAEHTGLPRRRAPQTGEQSQQCGLAGAVRAPG